MDKPHIVFRIASGVGNGLIYFAGVVESETPKRVTLARGPARHIVPRNVVARFANEADAIRLVQSISGVRGEYQRRERAAAAAATAAVEKLIAEAKRHAQS